MHSQENDGHVTIPDSNQLENTEVIHMDITDHSTYIVIITITQLIYKEGYTDIIKCNININLRKAKNPMYRFLHQP